jgi:hypothetical protein
MKLRFLTLFVIAFAMFACKNDKAPATDPGHNHGSTASADEPALFNDVMKIHDEVMPKMKDIEDLKVILRMKIDSLEQNVPNSKHRADFKFALIELNRADDMMTDWMHDFKEKYDTIKDEAGKKAYLELEKVKIEHVRNQMNSGLKIASQTIAHTPMD